MTAKQRWVGGIAALLIANIVAMVILMTVANGGDRSRVLPSYKGVIEKK